MNYDSAYNRCYSFLEMLYLDINLSIESSLIEYIITEELPYLKKAPLSASMGNDILRLTALYLLGGQFSDCVAQKISIELLSNLLRKNIDLDYMLPTSIENMFYYTSLLKNFRLILENSGSSIENDIDKLICNMEKRCCLLTDRGVFPAAGIYKNKKRTSPFPEIEGSHCFNEQGYFVFHRKKTFFFLKSTGSAPNSHADINSIIYRYDSIDILTEFGSGNSTTFVEQEKSPIAHTMPAHSDYLLNFEGYKAHFNYKKSKIKHITESTNGFNVITESTFDDISISRHFKLNSNILQIEDYIDGNYRKYCSIFNIPSISTDIVIDKNIVSYNISGLNIKISTSSGVAQLKTYHERHNIFYSILFTTSSNLPIKYSVIIDDSRRDIFLNEQQAFLSSNTFSAVHHCLENPFVENLFNLCNLSAITLYRYGRELYIRKNFEAAHRVDILNKIINNCSIKSSCKIGKGSTIAYGGLGVLIHADSIIGEYCNIGSNVTLASAPIIGNYCYIGTGSRIIKYHLSIGDFCIIGANSVVTHDIPPFSIVSGIPGRIVKKITPENIDKYITSYFAWQDKQNPEYRQAIKNKFLQTYEQYK